MKQTFKATILGLTILTLTSCAKVYYSPDADAIARKHQNIAILPPSVSIAARKKVDAEAIKEQQKTESLNFQKEMYSWMLRRKSQGKIKQEIQDIETTNAKLKKAGFPETPLTLAEMCDVLKVDGLISSNFALSKPMSEGAAVALALLVGAYGATNEISVSVSIKDCSRGKILWNYDHKFSGGIGSSPGRLVDGIMRQTSKRMPYCKKSK